MGPVSLCLAVASAVVILLTRKAPDRSLPILAWCLSLSLVLSLGAHLIYEPVGRATPLMLIDAAGLYATGMMAICRFDTPRWLYVIVAAFMSQCVAHLAYVGSIISNNQHILLLNALYVTELLALLFGATGQIERRPPAPPRSERAFG